MLYENRSFSDNVLFKKSFFRIKSNNFVSIWIEPIQLHFSYLEKIPLSIEIFKHLPQSLSSTTLLTELNKSYELSNALVNEKALKNLRIFTDKRIYIKVIKFNVFLNGAKKINLFNY